MAHRVNHEPSMKLAPVISLADYRARSRKIPFVVELRREHAHLEIVCEALAAAHGEDAWASVLEEWRQLDRGLRAHLLREERVLLGVFRASHPDEAEELVAGHAEIANTLDVLGVGVSLHRLSAGDIAQLLAALREHAEREEMVFFPWLDARSGQTG